MTKKNTGQNFLIDTQVANREIQYANINKKDVILEIGPGHGILTARLAKKAKQVVAIEVDKQLVQNLKKSMPTNVQVIHGDARKIDFLSIPRFNKIVSNLPFHISSQITFKLFKYDFSVAVLIYQKEFADRMTALPGNKNYSRLSVAVYYYSYCRILEHIPKNSFYPQPKVDACMVRLSPKKIPPFTVHDESFFFNLVRELFNQRRKKIRKTLYMLHGKKLVDIPYLDMRAGDLSPEQLGELCNYLSYILK